MLYVLIGLSLAFFAAMVWIALSRKSSFKIRIAALIALGVMFLTVVIGAIYLLSDATTGKPTGFTDQEAEVVHQIQEHPPLVIIILFLIFGGIIALIVQHTIKERRKHAAHEAKIQAAKAARAQAAQARAKSESP